MSESQRPKVWVVNFTGHNYHLAKPFGDLEIITDGMVSTQSFDRILGQITAKLRHSEPTDYILLSGLMILNFIAGGIWVAKHGSLRALVWDKGNAAKGIPARYREFNANPEQIDLLLNHTDMTDGQVS